MRFQEFKILVVLTFVACLTGFMSDIYVPSFLTMSHDLNASLSGIQQSMSIFMLSLALSQFIYGPLSEVLGRRIGLLMGLCIVVVGSAICMLTENLFWLMVGRFIQGAGAGACACLWRSIFRDVFTGQQIAKYGGYLGIVMVYIVAAAPFLGGYFEAHQGWRASFIASISYGGAVWSLVYMLLPETNTHRTTERLSIQFFSAAYAQLLKSPIFMGYGLCVFFTYGAFFSWFIVGPVLYAHYFDLPIANFGCINFFLGGTAMALGGIFNAKCIRKIGQDKMLRLGWLLMSLAGAFILILDLCLIKSIYLFLIAIFAFLFGITLIWPNAFSRAFAPFGAIAGYAGSLYSCMQLGGGAIIGWVSAFIPDHRPYPLALVFILTALGACLTFEYRIKPGNTQQ